MRAIAVAIALGLFVAVSVVAVGWAQPATPPRQEQQPAPGVPGPGMMRGPMMPMMGEMTQMMQACMQLMNPMMGTPAPPTQPGPGTK